MVQLVTELRKSTSVKTNPTCLLETTAGSRAHSFLDYTVVYSGLMDELAQYKYNSKRTREILRVLRLQSEVALEELSHELQSQLVPVGMAGDLLDFLEAQVSDETGLKERSVFSKLGQPE